jgi:transcription elongation factor GreA
MIALLSDSVMQARLRHTAPTNDAAATMADGPMRVKPLVDFMNAADRLKAREPATIRANVLVKRSWGMAKRDLRASPRYITSTTRSARRDRRRYPCLTMATQLSRSAYERLQAEFDDLTTRGRIEIAQKIEAARLLGDLSENGDYHAAKDEQGHMEGRIRELEFIIDSAEIIEATDDGSISAGSIVTIVYDGDSDDLAERYLIGHQEEHAEGADVMSPKSPLGAALLGKGKGDTVEYEAPTGTLRVRVLDVQSA